MLTIQAAGVEIREIDLSVRAQAPAGTTVFATGFTNQGPVDEVLNVSTITEFEQVYGKPTNAAERYLYHNVKDVLTSNANLLVSRIPYEDAATEKYSALIYPILSLSAGDLSADGLSAAIPNLSANSDTLSAADTHIIGEPEYYELNEAEYQQIINGNFTWNNSISSAADLYSHGSVPDLSAALPNCGMILLNDKKLVSNNKYEGYYVGVVDNTNLNPATDFNSVVSARSIGADKTYVDIPTTRMNFALSADKSATGGSISEILENLTDYEVGGSEFDDSFGLAIFKIRQSVTNPDTNKLDAVFVESYFGSMNYHKEQFLPQGGDPASAFIESEVEGSPNFKLFVNPNISKSVWEDGDRVRVHNDSATVSNLVNSGALNNNDVELLNGLDASDVGVPANRLLPHGVYKDATLSYNKSITNVSTKLNRIFELVDNWELFPIDIVIDAGLSTIAAAAKENNDIFDDEKYINIDELYTTKVLQDPGDIITNYRQIVNDFIDFAEHKRKDVFAIVDPLRNIFVQGQNNKVLGDKSKNFSQYVYWPLKHTTGSFNTNFAAMYGTWGKKQDGGLNKQIWLPVSGRLAGMHANNQPWQSAAGYERGILGGFNDIAIYPTQKHRDLLDKININAIENSPSDGFVVLGAKTLQAKPSAFDRIIARRTFLYLEKATRATAKYFVFRPNTLLTRTQAVNILNPIFDQVMRADGLYEFLIICDTRNNTPDVIDRNELVIDIYLKVVREGEKILVNFYNTRVGQDFSELIA